MDCEDGRGVLSNLSGHLLLKAANVGDRLLPRVFESCQFRGDFLSFKQLSTWIHEYFVNTVGGAYRYSWRNGNSFVHVNNLPNSQQLFNLATCFNRLFAVD